MRIKIIICLMVWCGISVNAENRIDKSTFVKLVDYANCQYLMFYIENSSGEEYLKNTYEKKIKTVLQKSSLENINDVPSFEIIKSLFPQKSNEQALSLAEAINKRKVQYADSLTDLSLINILITTRWGRVDLNEISSKVIAGIKQNFINHTPVNDDIVVNSPASTSDTTNARELIDSELKINYQSIIWWIFGFMLFVIIIFSYFLFRLWNRYSKLKNNIIEFNSKIDKAERFIKGFQQDIKPIQSKNTLNEKDIHSIADIVVPMVLDCVRLEIKEMNNTFDLPIQPQIAKQHNSDNPVKDNSLFFASKSEKQLTEPTVNSNNACFRAYNINGNDADFEYIGVVRNENWFEGICSIENAASDNLSDKKQIKTTQFGKLRKENNIWNVITPAKIKYY